MITPFNIFCSVSFIVVCFFLTIICMCLLLDSDGIVTQYLQSLVSSQIVMTIVSLLCASCDIRAPVNDWWLLPLVYDHCVETCYHWSIILLGTSESLVLSLWWLIHEYSNLNTVGWVSILFVVYNVYTSSVCCAGIEALESFCLIVKWTNVNLAIRQKHSSCFLWLYSWLNLIWIQI